MTIDKKHKFYNFSSTQLEFFSKELEEAKGFNELMFKKRAFIQIQKNESIFIAIYENISEYKKKYLIGEYESLRSIYKTKVPYTFWSKLYLELKKRKNADNSL